MASDLRLTANPGSWLYRGLLIVVASVLVPLVAYSSAAAQGPPSNYVIGPQDVLQIAVFDQQDLGGKYSIDADGTFTFPLIGRVKAGGLTLRQLESELSGLLVKGEFFKNPQLSVSVDQYRSQRIFVVGDVRNPGTIQLSGEMSLIEAVSRAGSALPTASGEALIVRARNGSTALIALPINGDAARMPIIDEANSEVLRVNLKDLQSGLLNDNTQLRDGDTVFVPRAETVYVFGQVKAPGAYPVTGTTTTVLQALSLAGGVTDRGATNRIRIVRLENGKQVEQRVTLNYVIRPGDTIIVPERFF